MKFIRKIKTMLSLPAVDKFLLVEALLTSAYVRFALAFLPFKIVTVWMGKVNAEARNELSHLQLIQVRKIHHILKLCEKYALWKTECYTLALTGKILLKRRRVPSTLYIGFKKSPEGKYDGHAWLKTPDFIITGDMDLSKFHVNAFFT